MVLFTGFSFRLRFEPFDFAMRVLLRCIKPRVRRTEINSLAYRDTASGAERAIAGDGLRVFLERVVAEVGAQVAADRATLDALSAADDRHRVAHGLPPGEGAGFWCIAPHLVKRGTRK